MKKILLMVLILAIASPAVAKRIYDNEHEAAVAKALKEKVVVQMVRVKKSEMEIQVAKYKAEAMIATAEAEFRIQEAEFRGLCEAVKIMDNVTWTTYCNGVR